MYGEAALKNAMITVAKSIKIVDVVDLQRADEETVFSGTRVVPDILDRGVVVILILGL